jgi:3-phosphoshikimate 1-carboxyvinyltransferase
MIGALDKLGFHAEQAWVAKPPEVRFSGAGPTDKAAQSSECLSGPGGITLNLANSGTSMRFLTALVSLGKGRYRLDGSPRMRERPIQDLIDGLQQLGVDIACEHDNGCPPVTVKANGITGGKLTMKADISSQFVSGLLMILPLAAKTTHLEVTGTVVSAPYVETTRAVISAFGGRIQQTGPGTFVIAGNQQYACREYEIEPDASAASYFFAAAAISQGEVTVAGLGRNSIQGDRRFVDILGQMGCEIHQNARETTVKGRPLCGVDVDMNDISDCVMTLGAVACFAKGTTVIRNVGHIRFKETDRLRAMAAELRRVGVFVEEQPDGLSIRPAPLRGAVIETYQDHRIAMSMALVGLRVAGIVIKDPGCVAKTYPNYFEDFKRLYGPA